MEQFFRQLGQFKEQSLGKIPSINQAHKFINELLEFLFPVICEKECCYNELKRFKELEAALSIILKSMGIESHKSKAIASAFMSKLPKVYELIKEDAEAIYRGDPAAKSIQEVIITYPGFWAGSIYRLAHELYILSIPLLPRIFSEYAHHKTGIDIHPGAKIGHHFCIDHGTGIVIGETTVIGNNVKIYQGVTLGALSVKKKPKQAKRHPTIEDDVTIYAGATILGGNTLIGHHSIIGGNAWLTKSVKPYSRVIHNSQITIINKNEDENQ